MNKSLAARIKSLRTEGVHSKCPGSKGPSSKGPSYPLVLILGKVFYIRDDMKYVWDALTHMTVHQIIGTQLTNYEHTHPTTRGHECTLIIFLFFNTVPASKIFICQERFRKISLNLPEQF